MIVEDSLPLIFKEIFKEAIASPGKVCPDLVEDWLSDDSEDEDYCPDNTSNIEEFEESFSQDACCSSDSNFSFDASLNFISYSGSGELNDEITNYRRHRRDVDYMKLYDEMFGKDPIECEEQSEDEDWGPYRKKKVRDASDICIAPTDGEDKDIPEKMALQSKISCDKRTFLRIPPDAIEKLRHFFAENELPSRTAKEELSKELGISVEKVDRWFKNKRYSAIKTRKAGITNQPLCSSDVSIVNEGHENILDETTSSDSSCFLPLVSIFHLPHHKKRIRKSENLTSGTSSVKKQKKTATNVRSNAIQVRSQLRSAACLKKHTSATAGNFPSMEITANVPDAEQPFANEMSALWALEKRLHQLKQRFLACKDDNESRVNKLSGEESVIFVPIAEVIEKKTS